MSYDAWLEAPYQQHAAEQERFERYAEKHGLDPEADEQEIVDRMVADDEDAAERAAEDRAALRAMEDWL
jgi:hypothetical protein